MGGIGSLFTLRGRLGRAAYWRAGLWQLGGLLAFAVPSGPSVGWSVPTSQAVDVAILVGSIVGGLALGWIGFAATVRRCHDRDRSAWWLLFGAVPVIGPLWVVIELCGYAGTPGANRFGPPSVPDPVREPDEIPSATQVDLESIVARWAAATIAPVSVAAHAPRRDPRRDDRAPVITRPGGFGRRGLD